MDIDLDKSCKILGSILHNSLADHISEFSDDDLRPFMPLLFSSTYTGNLSYGISNEQLLARVAGYPDGKRMLDILSFDYGSLIDSVGEKLDNCNLAVADDAQKMRIVLSAFLSDEQNSQAVASVISDDNLAECCLMISSAFLKAEYAFNIERFVLRLTSAKNGNWIILTVIMNNPHLLVSIMASLMSIQVSEECNRGRNKGLIMEQLCQLCPSIMSPFVLEMFSSRKDCLLAARLCSQFLSDDDFVKRLNALCFNRNSLFSQVIARSTSARTLTCIYSKIFSVLNDSLKSEDNLPHADLIHMAVFLHHHCSNKLTAEQLTILYRFICRKKVADEAYLVLAFATLFAIPQLINPNFPSNTSSYDNRIHEWIERCKEIVTEGKMQYFISNFLFLTVCVYTQNRNQANLKLRELFRTKVTVIAKHSEQLHQIFTASLFSDQELLDICTKQPIVPLLSGNAEPLSQSWLPVNTILILFAKHSGHIGPWLESQLSNLSLPIFPQLPELIERYAIHCANKGIIGLSLSFVERVFDGLLIDEPRTAARVLVILYLLSYQSTLDKLGTNVKNKYGTKIYSQLPIRYLLSIVARRQIDFDAVQAPLIKLSSEICPYMLPTVESVELTTDHVPGFPFARTFEQILPVMEKKGMHHIIQRLEVAPLSDQVRLLPLVVECYQRSLADDSSQTLVSSICRIWTRLENVIPKMLYESCVLAWLSHIKGEIELQDVYDYPALLFRAQRDIFFSPEHFRCFVRTLAYFVSASKSHLMRAVQTFNTNHPQDVERTDREALSVAVEHTKCALVVQLLIEVSDHIAMKDDLNSESEKHRRGEIRAIAFEYIHQIFIQDRMILKSVLFQTIPLHMIDYLVEEVPSMYVAVDFMQEILLLPDYQRRVVAIPLMVSIAKKYKTSSTLTPCELIIDLLHTLLKYAISSLNVQLFLKITPSLAKLPLIFPHLSYDVTQLLLRVEAIAKSRLALQPMIVNVTRKEEKRLITLIQENLASAMGVSERL